MVLESIKLGFMKSTAGAHQSPSCGLGCGLVFMHIWTFFLTQFTGLAEM